MAKSHSKRDWASWIFIPTNLNGRSVTCWEVRTMPGGSRRCAVCAVVLFCASTAWSQAPGSAEGILRHAIQLHQAGDVAGAIPEYRAYLKQVPGNVMARSNLGAALART